MDEQQIITTPAPSGFKLNIKSVAGLVVLLLLVSAIPLGVYLSQQTQIFRPKAAVTPVSGPETSLTLQAPSSVEPGKEIRVGVWARSDIDAANLFVSKLKFPTDLLQVSSINAEVGPLFVKNWIEKTFDNAAGTVSLSGGIPAPGYKTTLGQPSGLMAEVVFKTKKAGSATVTFDSESAILRNSDNTNILNIKRDVSFKIEMPAPSTTPAPTGGASAFKKALNFLGSPQFVQIPNSSYLNSYINFTVEAWIKPNLPSSNAFERSAEFSRIISKSSGSANAYDLNYISYNTTDGKVHYSYQFGVAAQQINCALVTADSQNGTTGANGATVSPEKASSWRHVAGVVRNGNLYIYENGQLVAKNEYNIQQTCNNTNTLQFGARSGGDWQDSYFKGQIDEVRLSRVARYDANFTVPTQPFANDAGIGGLWHLDGNVDDASGGVNNGQVQGGAQFVDSTIGIQVTPTPTGAGIKGDINGDGKVNLVDMSILLSRWGKTGTEAGKADLNADGVVNTFDYSLMLQILIQNGVIKGSQELSTELRR